MKTILYLKSTRFFALSSLLTIPLFFVLIISFLFCPGYNETAAQTVIDTIKLGPEAGNGFGAATVAVNHRINMVYVVNRISSNISVINGLSNNVVATIDICSTSPSNGIAVNQHTNLIYVIDQCDAVIRVIDGSLNKVIADVRVDGMPRKLAVNPRTNRIYVVTDFGSFRDSKLSVIDGLKNIVIETIEIDDIPQWIDINPETGKIYLAVSNPFTETGSLTVIDGRNNKKINKVHLNFRPNGLTINSRTNRVYVADSIGNDIYVISGSENKVIATVNIGEDLTFEMGLAVNPTTNKIFITTYDGEPGSGKVIIMNGKTNKVIDVVNTGDGPVGIDVNARTNRIYVADNLNHKLTVISRSFNIIETVSLGIEPVRMAVNPSTNLIYVTVVNEDAVYVIDGSDNKVVNSIKVGRKPAGIEVNVATNQIYVANSLDGSVNVIDGLSNSVIDIIEMSGSPIEIGVNPVTNKVYVTTLFPSFEFSSNVQVIDGLTNEITGTIEMSSSVMPPGKISINPEKNMIYISTFNGFMQKMSCFPIEVINGTNDSIVDIIKVNNEARGIAANPLTNLIYVTLSDGVAVINGETNGIVDTIDIEGFAGEVSLNTVTNRIYVAVSDGRTQNVRVINGTTNSAVTTIKEGLRRVIDIDTNSDTGIVYILDAFLSKITVIDDLAKPVLPVANFTADTQFGDDAPFTVRFTDLSIGVVEEWHWNFGDGGQSDIQNPVHEYLERKSFTVSLTVTGPEGSDTEIKDSFISVIPVSIPLPVPAPVINEFSIAIPELTPCSIPVPLPGSEFCP